MKCDELEKFDAASNADLSAGYDHRYAYDADEVDEAIAELKAENERLKAKLESVQATAYADSVDAGMRERRLKRALWRLKALYFYRMFQWSMKGKRFAPEDDEPEDFFMECLGKHTKRKSEWGKEADMFDDARIVCIKKSEEYNL